MCSFALCWSSPSPDAALLLALDVFCVDATNGGFLIFLGVTEPDCVNKSDAACAAAAAAAAAAVADAAIAALVFRGDALLHDAFVGLCPAEGVSQSDFKSLHGAGCNHDGSDIFPTTER